MSNPLRASSPYPEGSLAVPSAGRKRSTNELERRAQFAASKGFGPNAKERQPNPEPEKVAPIAPSIASDQRRCEIVAVFMRVRTAFKPGVA